MSLPVVTKVMQKMKTHQLLILALLISFILHLFIIKHLSWQPADLPDNTLRMVKPLTVDLITEKIAPLAGTPAVELPKPATNKKSSPVRQSPATQQLREEAIPATNLLVENEMQRPIDSATQPELAKSNQTESNDIVRNHGDNIEVSERHQTSPNQNVQTSEAQLESKFGTASESARASYLQRNPPNMANGALPDSLSNNVLEDLNVETQFDVFRVESSSGKANMVGHSKITFNSQQNSPRARVISYALSQLAEVDGQTIVSKSEGRVSLAGLRPDRYSSRLGDTAVKQANFAWSDKVIVFDGAGIQQRTEPLLLADVQDKLSFLYQFAFSEPVQATPQPSEGSVMLSVADAEKSGAYALRYMGDEVMETPMGVFNTLHINTQHIDGAVEVWLAKDMRYLPIKIRYTEKDGLYTEYIATKIEKLSAKLD